MALPRRARRLWAYWRAEQRTLRQGLVALALSTLAGFVAGLTLAHIMMTLGRYHRLILDSWTRPTYSKKVRRAKVSDASIERRFRRYGPYAGLAFWLYLTRDWVD